ncbi:MAG: hypothetical protein JWN60_1549 [Acidobacteria bacterium]|jgi:hypothetical protein|nr:hypothetical protein [Acidobacteriota bacterium]
MAETSRVVTTICGFKTNKKPLRSVKSPQKTLRSSASRKSEKNPAQTSAKRSSENIDYCLTTRKPRLWLRAVGASLLRAP